MARKQKKGFNYFTLDVSFSDSIRLATIEAGNNAIPILIELWQKIYGSHGYYMDFKEDHKLLFISSALTKVSIDELDKIINIFFKRGIFSKDLYQKYEILTSDSIQERYIDSCNVAKRQNTLMFNEYICCDLSQCEIDKVQFKSIKDEYSGINTETDCINEDNSGNNEDNSGKIPKNSGKSTYKIESIDSKLNNTQNSGNKIILNASCNYDYFIQEIKNSDKIKEDSIRQYKLTELQYNNALEEFIFQNKNDDPLILVSYTEEVKHFKRWLAKNSELIKSKQTNKPNVKLL